MTNLGGKVAWVTGAGTGIGEAAALALAEAAKGRATVEAGDVTDGNRVNAIAAAIRQAFGRLDVLVNNAGVNLRERHWSELTLERIDTILKGNLSSAFYVAAAALPMMRAQKDGVIIHTASWAGRFVSALTGPGYSAAKHALVAASHSLNMEECRNGIRSCVICPGEVATPILEHRPVPVTAEERARMLQPEDLADLILFVATRPKHVCLNEVLISPTWNRSYIRQTESPGP